MYPIKRMRINGFYNFSTIVLTFSNLRMKLTYNLTEMENREYGMFYKRWGR